MPETAETTAPPTDPEARAVAARREAETRARQQAAVVELGLSAILAQDLRGVLDEAVRTAAATLGVGFAKVLQLEPDGNSFLLRAGVGWQAGLVGSAQVPVGRSQGGYTLRSQEPIVVEDLGREERINRPQLLIDHGVVSGMTVLIRTRQDPWGVLGVHSAERRSFTADDVNFLLAIANVVAAVLERERIEEQLRRSQAELALKVAEERLRRSERLASLGTLAAGIAHEINNPVNTILMTAESSLLALGNGRKTERLEEDLRIVVEEAERCGEIVRKVLEFVRDRKPERKPEDLNEVVRSAITMAQKTLGEQTAAVGAELASDLPAVSLNRAEIEQALIHLIRNAAESGGGEPVAITVRTGRTDRGAMVAVADDGQGIEHGVRDRIFDPFFTTRREKGGTGLGLSLAHSIVTDHGGTIDLESEPRRGTTVRIELPVEAGAA
ncbi:MAG TPA: ATP-binding protein [Thermoanaerobaculia bacterium]|nr:ATP-binding protein [Thermoanaerobaculia bacterium]